MSNKIAEGIIYFFVLILGDLFGYKLISLEKAKLATTSEIYLTSSLSLQGASSSEVTTSPTIKIEFKTPSSTVIITSSSVSSSETSSQSSNQ